MKAFVSVFLVLLVAATFQDAACRSASRKETLDIDDIDDIDDIEDDEGRIFTALLAQKLLGAQAVQPAAQPPVVTTISTTLPNSQVPAAGGTGATGPISISSQFTTGTNVAVPVGATAIGGPGPGLSSDDPDFGQDGALIRNKMRENCADDESNEDGANDDIDLDDLLYNNNRQRASPARVDPDTLMRQNQSLRRQIQRNNQQYQAQQRRAALRRRNRANARRRAQRNRSQTRRQQQQFRTRRVRQDAINRQKRRNLRRGPARKKIVRRIIV